MSALSLAVLDRAAGRASRRCCTTRVAIATCSASSRICSARTRWACATCCSITGDPGPRRRLSGRDRGVRRRLDRSDQPRLASQPRRRHRRAADRRADRVPHRRVGESGRVEPRRGAPAVRLQGRGRRGVRRSRGRFSTSADSNAFLKRIESARLPVIAGIFPFDSARNAEFMANEVPGVRVPDALLDRMRRADDARGRRGRRHCHCARDCHRPAPGRCRASRSRPRPATSTPRSACSMDFADEPDV